MNSTAATSPLPRSTVADGSNALATRALIVGLIGLAIGFVGILWGVHNHDSRPIVGWLIGFGFWFSMSVGMLYLVMLFYLFDAGWAIVVRRQIEHALAAMPYIALCFVPLLLLALGVFGKESQGLLWQWLDPSQPLVGKVSEKISEDPLFIHKAGFLSLPLFLVRLAIYALVFCGLAHVFRKNSFALDRDSNPKYVLRCRKWAAFGVIAVSLAATFAVFDFFMSLSYTWFSTMYGVWFFATSMRAGLCGTVLICFFMSAKPGRPLFGIYNRAHQYLLGCLCLTFTIFWAYITFCQYFLVYHANIPEETFWYVMRDSAADGSPNSWWYVSLAIIFCYFFAPFFALLSYDLKVCRRALPVACCWILCFHILDLFFNIVPARLPDASASNPLHYTIREFSITPWDVASLIGVGGLCAWAFFRSQSKSEAIPIHDPRIVESLNYRE